MKLFIKNAGLFIVLFLVTVILVYGWDGLVIKNQFSQTYNASIIDKIERLQSIDEPKIILVGNSNLCFGMESELIEKEFGMPVVNLGLHGGLGNAFHENMARLNIGEGDIVIVCHSSYDDDDILDPKLVCITLEWNMELWCILRQEDIFPVVLASPNYVFQAAAYWISGKGNLPVEGSCYNRSSFNEYGDIGDERTENAYIFREGSIIVPAISEDCVKRLNEFNQYVTDQGGTLLIAGYPIGDGEYTPPKSEYQEFQEQLEEKLDAVMISDYMDYFFPYSYFYDSEAHLTSEGAKARTKQLIKDLSFYFDSVFDISAGLKK